MLRKTVVSIITFIFLIVSLSFPAYAQTVGVSAKSAVLINADTKEVLYEKDAYTKRSMASTTKIMTAIVALENADLQQVVEIKKEIITVEGTSMGLRDGDKVTVEALLYGLLLESGNDAANVIAHHIGGSAEDFAKMMNAKAKEIGMNNTNFVTPSGLDDEQHYTTAYDMALLAAYALKNDTFLQICSCQSKRVQINDKKVTLTNHNRLLKMYDDCIGVKTGFTKKSGRCLVSAAQRNNVRLVAVTLSAPDDWNDAKKLFNYGFSQQKSITLTTPQDKQLSINVVSGTSSSVRVQVKEEVSLSSKSDISERISRKILLKKFYYAPIKDGEVMGKIIFFLDGEKIKETQLIACESVKSLPAKEVEESKNFFEKIKDFFSKGRKTCQITMK